MKARASTVGEVFTLGGLEEGQFYLANVAKIISTVVNGLYSDKIRAPVREYCTNAYDAHLAAGKADEPFLVQLPTRLDPTFRVRDYGLGLDHAGVLRTFTGLGLSTKDTSNDMVGMLGYGSKSGFAYTNGFWVVAHDGQTKRLYDAYMGEDGVPYLRRRCGPATSNGQNILVPPAHYCYLPARRGGRAVEGARLLSA